MKQTFVKFALVFIILAAGLGADFFSKKWALGKFKNKAPVAAVKGFVDFGFIENRGMVFGILNRGGTPHAVVSAVTWVRVIVCVAVSVYIAMNMKAALLLLLPFLFIWMGAVGNLIDSFARGYVIDFIHIHAGTLLDWPFFFNLADAYVCVGAGILVLIGLFGPKERVAPPAENKGTV
jgi:signal peptidase II